MQPGQWQFRPGVIPTIATILILPLLISLGVWQLDRAEQKKVLYQDFLERQNSPPVYMNTDVRRKNKAEMMWRQVNISGVFATDKNILLDNQTLDGKAGYFVYTPLLLSGEKTTVLVNRGWIVGSGNREDVPVIDTPETVVEIKAVVKDVPNTGILLDEASIESLGPGVYRVQRINLDEISHLIDQELLPYVARLEPESNYGFIRKWQLPGSDEEKHLGYAFQWFALAITLVIIFIVVNTKKRFN